CGEHERATIRAVSQLGDWDVAGNRHSHLQSDEPTELEFIDPHYIERPQNYEHLADPFGHPRKTVRDEQSFQLRMQLAERVEKPFALRSGLVRWLDVVTPLDEHGQQREHDGCEQ